MQVIVDGYNLIMKIGRLAERVRMGELQYSREVLLHLLARAKRSEFHSATVVFDARRLGAKPLPGPEGLSLRRECRGRMGVIFSPPGSDADEVIKELAEERALVGKARELLVVTSDRSLASYVRSVGARIETSEECARSLIGRERPRHGRPTRQDGSAPAEPEKELAAPGDDEVGRWLRYFEMKGDEPIEL
ncbi:MAG TPA: NYN domain-containing protein [Planctomycetota bacterium]|nr:NYN domain-containing protein [Planctomycetota bacterium]